MVSVYCVLRQARWRTCLSDVTGRQKQSVRITALLSWSLNVWEETCFMYHTCSGLKCVKYKTIWLSNWYFIHNSCSWQTYIQTKMSTCYVVCRSQHAVATCFRKDDLESSVFGVCHKIKRALACGTELYCMPTIILVMRGVSQVTRMAEKRNACRVLVGKPEGKTASWKT
jgi:hypothetical protein